MPKRVVTTKSRAIQRQPAAEFPFELTDVERLSSANGTARRYRLDAWKAFTRLPLPTNKDEPWRRTDIRSLELGSFRLPEPDAYQDLASMPTELISSLAHDTPGGSLNMLPGGNAELELSPHLMEKGVIFTDLQTAELEYPDLLHRVRGSVVPDSDGKFAALTSALSQNGALVYIPAGVEVKEPLHSLLWGPGSGLGYFSHLIVYLENHASLTYIHESASPTEEDGQTLHGGIIEIVLEDEAHLRFVDLQSWGEHVWNFTHERARIGRDSTIDWIFGGMGTHLTKSFMDLDLAGEGSTGRMSGFYFTRGSQHLDLDTQQNHLVPNTTSDLLYKGALIDHSRVVWQGMIFVAPGAQKTDGFQANRNLVLSSHARADSIPGLEIQADDVRCTHGATVGKIDPELLFYLRSRGIPEASARRLIVEGFFQPVMERIPFGGVRERFHEATLERMEEEAPVRAS